MRVLLVEDNPDDVAAVERLALQVGPRVRLISIRDGREAADYLFRSGRYANAPAPQLVLLDIGLPGLPGIELLRQIKDDVHLQEIPVVVVSGSDRDEDVRVAEALGAHSHVVKPLRAQDFEWIANSVVAYHARVRRIAAQPRAGRNPGDAVGAQPEG